VTIRIASSVRLIFLPSERPFEDELHGTSYHEGTKDTKESNSAESGSRSGCLNLFL